MQHGSRLAYTGIGVGRLRIALFRFDLEGISGIR
jgi:hypothetical protein